MTKLRLLLVLFSLLMFAVLARAQDTVISPGPRGAVIATIGGVAGASFTHGNTGLPFSADVVEENDRFLADRNHIHFEVHGKFFRDSEGRIRTETEAPVFNSDSKPSRISTSRIWWMGASFSSIRNIRSPL